MQTSRKKKLSADFDPLSPVQVDAMLYRLQSVREHTQPELQRKCTHKGFDPSLVTARIQFFSQQNLQNDQRYLEAYARSRINRGNGPLRIEAELRERGLDTTLLESYYWEESIDWLAQISAVFEKKFAGQLPSDFKERSKQIRFFQYRGFSMEQIQSLYE